MSTIEEALEELAAGRMVVVVDDEDRENEGDLVMAAQFITPDAINFMARFGRGLICLPMSRDMADKLELPLMTRRNGSKFGTNFTVSIEARRGVTTGISAADRAHTILTAVADEARADDLVTPGHVFPLRAQQGGVLTRAGQTEGSVDLAHLAGLKPAAVICEIIKDDGCMARMPDLELFAAAHNFKIAAIRDIIRYRMRRGQLAVRRTSHAHLPTRFGQFEVIAYENDVSPDTHLAIIKGDVTGNESVLVRVHSECLTGDALGSLRCDCGEQLGAALSQIEREGRGVLIYMRQEGRGIGLGNKLKAYALQDKGLDTVEANVELGFRPDLRDYGIGAQILVDLGVRRMRIMTNNPRKIIGLEGYGIEIAERVPIEMSAHPDNAHYLLTKKEKLGHLLSSCSCLKM
jgi:3,4-dihydroxy 2-butanone 4-phosphate synthase/GTP cyclohydrolase II